MLLVSLGNAETQGGKPAGRIHILSPRGGGIGHKTPAGDDYKILFAVSFSNNQVHALPS